MAQTDLNLIRTFVVLYEARSVTAAAERLHVTQPSVSYALGRLRELFDDKLFVRRREGMAPTFVAEQLYRQFRDPLACIDGAVESSRDFNPASSERRYRLALTDLGEMTLLPPILARLQALAPQVELEVVPLEIERVGDWLVSGTVNAAICSRPLHAPAIARRALLRERYVALMAREHPTIGAHMSLDQFLAARHAVVTPSSGHGLAAEVLRERGILRKISLEVPHFSILPRLLIESDLVAIVPGQIARRFAVELPLKIVELPFTVPEFDVALHWYEPATRAPAQRWFHDSVVAAIDDALDHTPS
ncbi:MULTISPECIES: LysR family transcriptional regulator [Modicisalibacter]|uniref:LysR family transcriptional regulator n=1 Tax=Modicisalibacter TaxID=574347 RepID=UPI00100C06D2|nr:MULTISPECIES: LysR family transcriptional regulator [Halomonadaceae]MBZ9557777.1 LysR family transcriptional regulator [Modicisalibacter sp. R2A 31.J]MBZ9573558.1 LysR family transcriptional regulator [Modicisalibacter sp. MOD 31.J]